MNIPLRELRPNPYHLGYPESREKIEYLKGSIRSTGFWDNLLVRKACVGFEQNPLPGVPRDQVYYYQIAYGHHRLLALHELVNEHVLDLDYELELPVRRLDDQAMVRIMVIEQAHESPEVRMAAIKVVRGFLSSQCKISVESLTVDDIYCFLGGISGAWRADKISRAIKMIDGRAKPPVEACPHLTKALDHLLK